MWDEEQRNKEQMRNQMIVVVLMSVALIFFMKSYSRQATQQPPLPNGEVVETVADQDSRVESGGDFADTVADSVDDTDWPYLPALPEQDNPEADEVVLENEHLSLVFTKIGARLKKSTIVKDDIQLVPVPDNELPDSENIYPLGLNFSDAKIGNQIDRRRFELTSKTGDSVTFSLALGESAIIRKTFRLDTRENVLNVDVEFENREDSPKRLGMDQYPAYVLNWGPNIESGDRVSLKKDPSKSKSRPKGISPMFVRYGNDGTREWEGTDKMSYDLSGNLLSEVEWVAVKSAYFVVAMKSEFEIPGESRAWAAGSPKRDNDRYSFGVSAQSFDTAPNTASKRSFSVYMGPHQFNRLKVSNWESLQKVYRLFESDKWKLMDKFAVMFLRLMNWFHDHVYANYGFAIIFVTIIVRLGMYPLTLKSMKSMKRMQQLAPEIEALKEKYGENQKEMNAKMMEMYRERGINPVGGCFPMLLQMPVFIAFYRMIWNAYELRGAEFIFWIKDLSEPDRMFQIPYINMDFNLIPILMGIAMVLSQKLMPTSGPSQNPQQKMMMTFMPVFFAFICYSMASGTSLYILTSTVLGMLQQKMISGKKNSTEPPKKKKVVGKKQHFYTAAQARKRQAARDKKKGRS